LVGILSLPDNAPRSQISPVEYRAGQFGAVEPCAAQIGIPEIGGPAIRIGETGIEEIALFKIGPNQGTSIEIRARRAQGCQLQAGKIVA